MKHSLRRSRTVLHRCILAATAVTLTLTGGTVGHQLATADQPPASVTAAANVAPLAAGSHLTRAAPKPGKAPRSAPRSAKRPAPTTGPTTAPTSAPTTAPSSAPTTTTTTTGAATSSAPAVAVPSTAAVTPSTTGAPAMTAPAPDAGAGPHQPGNMLAGVTFYGPNPGAAEAAGSGGRSAEDAALLSALAGVPTATWLGSWSGDVTQTVRQVVTAARASGAVPVLVAYNVPDTDCGGYSAGGAASPAEYAAWIQDVAAGIGTAEAVVVVEPDALAQLCGDPAARYAMLASAIDVLEVNPATHTYLDAGHSNWHAAQEMAGRLRAAGVADADGFALNVSNFQTTASNVTYGRAISAALGGAHFVIDTSRNGNGPGSDWCNPAGRAVGERPTTSTGQDVVDAFLWVKRPGESDGTCNGGPPAGNFWPEYALGLMHGR